VQLIARSKRLNINQTESVSTNFSVLLWSEDESEVCLIRLMVNGNNLRSFNCNKLYTGKCTLDYQPLFETGARDRSRMLSFLDRIREVGEN